MYKLIAISVTIILIMLVGSKYILEQQAFEENESILRTLDPQACASLGGEIQNVCMSGFLACVKSYSDFGKTCSSSSECDGRCVYLGDEDLRGQSNVFGQCEDSNNPCGCWTVVENGEILGTLCAD